MNKVSKSQKSKLSYDKNQVGLGQRPFFTVVIPALNEAYYLPRLLSDLAKQTFVNFEVIVVDAFSADNTASLAQEFCSRLDLIVLQTRHRHVAYQRNLGAEHSRGHYLIFMDADNRLPHYFLQGLKYQLDKNPVEVFSTKLLVAAYAQRDQALIKLINSAFTLSAKFIPQAPGALIGLKRELSRRFKFKEDMHSSEDRELVIRVTRHGHRFAFFQNPGYKFSLRRFKKEGELKLLLIYGQKALQYATGHRFARPVPCYPMTGGCYYQQAE